MQLEFSDRSKDLQIRIAKFLDDHIYPAEAIYAEQMADFTEQGNRWQIPQIIEDKKEIAKSEGLWNLFLPENPLGDDMTNLDYAPLCELMGRSGIAGEIFNCSAPDTGNMEVFAKYANEEQQERWLKPLLNGEIRSAFAMTEPAVASSDATNICSSAVLDGDEYVINGEKWWTSGAGERVAFGKKLSVLGANFDYIAESRIDIETSRLLTLNAAHMMDTVGNKVARSEIAQIKVHVPIVACRLIDRAIQIHGGGGVSQDFPLASMYAHMRTLRLADGPDEVHRRTVAREELGKYTNT